MRNIVVAGAAFLGAFGVCWTFVECYNYFKLTWFVSPGVETLYFLIMLLISMSFALAWLLYDVGRSGAALVDGNWRNSFDENLVETLESEIKKRNFSKVLRIGVALNRALFEEGNFTTRLKIGYMIEEAALACHKTDIQISALIDSIGWSLIEIGEYDEAVRKISHGIKLSEKEGNTFYHAKGLRHLGAIERRRGNFSLAEARYQQALEISQNLRDGTAKDEFLAGLSYAFACLYLSTGDLNKANGFVDMSIESFSGLKDDYRLNMSYVTKGDILHQQGQIDESRDLYRLVLENADKNTEKLQLARSSLGLYKIYMDEHDWVKARDVIERAMTIDLKDFKNESALVLSAYKDIPNH